MSLWHALCLTKYTSIIKTDVSKWHNQWSSHFCATQEECYSNPDVSIPFVKSANTAFGTDYQMVASHSWSVEGGMVRGAHIWYLKLWLCRIVNCNIKVFFWLRVAWLSTCINKYIFIVTVYILFLMIVVYNQ